jgi:lysophospholipase L1-like esterase
MWQPVECSDDEAEREDSAVSVALRAVAGGVVGATLVLGAPAAYASAGEYVALGDSYSSGNGAGGYLDDGTSCRRSVYSYPSLLARSQNYSLDLRACSGATTADVTRVQLDALGAGTDVVTLTIGGNDAGFAHVLITCAKPAVLSNCDAAINRSRKVVTKRLPARLRRLYRAVRARAPHARVVVAGYPRLFNGEDCNAATWFSPREEKRLNAVSRLLDRTIAAAAKATGVAFADPTSAFRGHAICDRHAWLNGLSRPLDDSYHPNRRGYSAGYLPLVRAKLTGQ